MEAITSDRTPAQSGEAPNSRFAPAASSPLRPPIRLLVPSIVLTVFWIVTEGGYRIELGMFHRFISRMIAFLVLLLFFLIWGMTRRHFSLLQRGGILATVMAVMVVAGEFGHPSTGIFATAMIGLPIVMTLSTIWLWRARSHGFAWEFSGISVTATIVFGIISLLRWDGMDGRQRPVLNWRWNVSGEERFLGQGALRTSIPAQHQRPELQETAEDWSSFRGGNREGVVDDVVLADWSQSPPRELWRRLVGPAWSSVISVGEYLFTQEQRGDREAVVCYRAATGDEVWVHTSQVSIDRFEESLSGTGPRATPTFHNNLLYTYGTKGRFECLNSATGETRWSHDLFEMTGAAVPHWGAATSPLIVGDLVITFTGGKHDNSLLAFDQLTGDVRWQAPGGTVSYSMPQVMTFDRQPMIVMHDELGVSAFRIADGNRLWHHPSPHAASFQPMLQAHLSGPDEFIVNWDAGLLCVKVHHTGEEWKLEERWKTTKLKPSFNDFFIDGDVIYGLDDGILSCFDFKTGKRLWKRGRYGFGQMLHLPQNKELLIVSEQGEVVRVATDPKEHRELGKFKAIEGKTWNHPMLARGLLVVRNDKEMACFDLRPASDVSTALKREFESDAQVAEVNE